MKRKTRLAVWKLASCDGCQLSLLDCEDELLTLADNVEIVHFLELSSAVKKGRIDVSLVEGSVSTPADAERIRAIRKRSRLLVTIGACATAGGIQALRNGRDSDEFRRVVYARTDYIDALETSTPVSDHVAVDHELRGCPISQRDLLELLSALLAGRRPQIRRDPVCQECKRRGIPCVLVRGLPCLGPVTHAGCGAICPAYGRGCYGCFGPAAVPNTASLARKWRELGTSERDLHRSFQTFNAGAPAFRDAAGKTEPDE